MSTTARRAEVSNDTNLYVGLAVVAGIALVLILYFTLEPRPNAGPANIQVDVQLAPGVRFSPFGGDFPIGPPVSILSKGRGAGTGHARRFAPQALTSTGNMSTSDISTLSILPFSLMLAQTLTITGQYSSTPPYPFAGNTITLYNATTLSQTSGTFAYDLTSLNSTALAITAATNISSFSNMATAAGRATLSTTHNLKAQDKGRYYYVLINWYPTIVVRGSVTLYNGVKLYTTNGTVDGSTGQTTSVSLTTGAGGPAYIQTANNGLWTRIIAPDNGGLPINDTTLTPGLQVHIKLIFNTQFRYKGYNDKSACASCNVVESAAAGNGMYMPPLDLTAVAYVNGEKVSVETYYGTPVDYASNKFLILLQLYYIGSQGGKPIRGMHTDTLFQPDTVVNYQTFPRLLYVANHAGASLPIPTQITALDLSSYDNVHVMISNFVRQTTVLSSVNATVNCFTSYFITPNCANGVSFVTTFQLVRRTYA